jgi:hypothetical protein
MLHRAVVQTEDEMTMIAITVIRRRRPLRCVAVWFGHAASEVVCVPSLSVGRRTSCLTDR